MDSDNSLIDRARELGLVWCIIRWLTAIPLLIVVALTAFVPDSGLGLLFWREWVTLHPLVSRPTPRPAASSRAWDTVPPNATGRTITALRPTGKVLIGGVSHEARSEGGWVDAGCDVFVVASDGNGIIVREHIPKTT